MLSVRLLNFPSSKYLSRCGQMRTSASWEVPNASSDASTLRERFTATVTKVTSGTLYYLTSVLTQMSAWSQNPIVTSVSTLREGETQINHYFLLVSISVLDLAHTMQK